MATTADEKKLYKNLQQSFLFYERHRKNYRDKNLEEIIKLSRKIGCKDLIRYASMPEDKLLTADARNAHTRLENFIRDYYETNLFITGFYGSIKLLDNLTSQAETTNDLVESFEAFMNFYLDYDGIHDPDILTIINSIKEKGILPCLRAIKYNYTSSGFMELKELFYKIEAKYLPILEAVNALRPFLATCPIEEIA